MKKHHNIVLSILSHLPKDITLTSAEILKEMEPAERGQFPGGVKDINLSLDAMREKALVENGNSEIKDRRIALTWRATQLGIEVVNGKIPLFEPEEDKLCGIVLTEEESRLSLTDLILERRAQKELPPPVTVADKYKKIACLQQLSPILHEEISAVVDAIAGDIERLSDAS
jgi:hypothetical protein